MTGFLHFYACWRLLVESKPKNKLTFLISEFLSIISSSVCFVFVKKSLFSEKGIIRARY